MKRSPRLLIAVLFPLVIGHVINFTACAAEKAMTFRAGAQTVDISPTGFPVIVNAMFNERSAITNVDPLYVKALVLDDGAMRITIAVVDTCMMSRDLIDRAKEIAQRSTGIPAERILVSATHTHSAPSAMGCLGSRLDTNYAAFLIPRIAEAIIGANKKLEPARIGWTAVNDWEHTFNRSWIRRSDRIQNDPFGQPTILANMHPGHESPDVTGPSGTVDPGLTVLSVQTPQGHPIALLANYSQHYYGSPLLSADYYGRFAQHISALIGATNSSFVPIMSQGTSGDLMWMDYATPKNDIGYDAYAKEVATRAFEAYQRIQYHPWVPLRMAERKLALNYRVPDDARLAWARRVVAGIHGVVPGTQAEIYAQEAIFLHERPSTELKLQAVRIGDLGIAAIPNEVYALTGLKIKAQSPLETTFNIELANGSEGYIPPPEQHVLGGYTTWPARTAGLEVQAEPRITETALSLLEEVTGKPRRQVISSNGLYPIAVLASKPLAYWRMDEMAMPLARNSSGEDYAATYEDGVAFYLPGPGSGSGFRPKPELKQSSFSGPNGINRAVHFAGGRMRSKLAKLGKLYSVELWFWNGFPNTARPVTGYLFSRGNDRDPAAEGDHIGIGGTYRDNEPGKLFFFNGNGLNTVLSGKTQLAMRSWNHLVLARDGKQVTVYLNGNTTPEISGEAESSVPDGAELFIGGRCDNFANFEGKMDEVAIYDRVLSGAEAAQHYKSAGLPRQLVGVSETSSPQPPPLDSSPLSPTESLKKIHVRPGYEVELVAAEPLLESPVAIDWDDHGRLWVAEMVDYPLGLDGKGKPGGRVRILEDTDGDGKYDKTTLVAEGVRFPTGIITWRDGAIITAAPEILLLKPEGKGWSQKVLYSGFFEANQQLRVNGLRWGLDNWVYCANGAHHGAYGTETRIKSTITGNTIALGSRDFRFKPDTGELDLESGPSQFGRNPDNWGNWFGVQNSWPLWHYVLQDHYIRRNPHVPAPDPVHQVIGPKNPQVFPSGKLEKRFHSFEESGHFTSACAAMIYRDELLFGTNSGMHSFTCEPFHNLVHHGLIEDDGVSFKGRRAVEEQTSEFFSSADRWTRPVMTRTGPDGALWVVDMYRYMIEHPEWLPPNGRAELMPHYRAGEDRGRIYRVFPANRRPSMPQNLDKLEVPKLVAELDSPNGWQRDKIQQMLVWKQDPQAVPLLEQLASNGHVSSLTRLHALCTLDGLSALKPELVERALGDADPGVRINALRLAESRLTLPVLASATKLLDDPNPKVLLQLACTLGQWTDPGAGKVLGRLAVTHFGDKFIIAAVMSSSLPHCRAVVDAAVLAGGQALASLSEPLLNLSLALDERDSVARLLQPALTGVAGFSPEQMERFSQFLDTLARRKTSWTELRDKRPGDALANQLQVAPILFSSARALASDVTKSEGERLTAAALLARESSTRMAAVQILSSWFTPKTPGPIQRSAVKTLGLTADDTVPTILLKNWGALGPETRLAILDELMSRESWTFALVQQIEGGLISQAILDPARKDRLLRHGSSRVKELAAKALNANGTASRAKAMEDFRPSLALAGDSRHGGEIHAKLCAVCHKLGNVGNDIGPNLQSVSAHPAEKLLTSILDPNASIEPGYLAYSCTLVGGEELYGIIAAETANSLIMKMADGKTQTILRGNIASLRSSNLSLMPEGLEAGMSKQDLADLIAFLRLQPDKK